MLACFWSDYLKGKVETEFKWDTITVSKQDNLSVLKQKLYETYNIPLDKDLYVFKKMDLSLVNYNIVEIMNNESDLHKAIFMNAIFDNTKLYVETRDKKDDSWTSNFATIFCARQGNVQVRFNFPVNPEGVEKVSISQYRWENEIPAQKTWTLRKVKQMIGEYLNLKEDKFIIKPFSHNRNEIRNLDQKLEDLSPGNVNIYTEFGIPLGESTLTIIYRSTKDKCTPFRRRLLLFQVVPLQVHRHRHCYSGY